MKTLITAAALVLVSCGHETLEPVVVYVPVPQPTEQADDLPAEKTTVCQVLLTDAHGNISRLTRQDAFTRDPYFAGEFTQEQASEFVRLKTGKVAGVLSRLCYEKEQR